MAVRIPDARLVGAFYLLTFATSIPALALKQAYLHGDAGVASLHWAVALELLLALCCIGTAVAFLPIGARTDPALAVGFVAVRVLEATAVLLGVIALGAVADLRSTAPTTESQWVEFGLIAAHDWAFLLGPGLLPAINAVLFGTVLYRRRLVPRLIPLLGLCGAPLLVLSVGATVTGLIDQVSPIAGLAALPIAVWEFSIGVWLLVVGVRSGVAGRDASTLAETPPQPA